MKEVKKRGCAGSIELTDWQDEKINCCQNKVLPSVLLQKSDEEDSVIMRTVVGRSDAEYQKRVCPPSVRSKHSILVGFFPCVVVEK